MSTQRQARQPRPIPDPLDPEETLEIEKRWLPKAGILAIVAGILPLIGFFLQNAINQGAPNDVSQVKTVAQSLVTYATDQQGEGLHGFRAEIASYLADKVFLSVLSVVITGIGVIAAGFVLYGLLRSSWRRRPSFPRWFMWLPVIGAFAFAIGTVAAIVYTGTKLSDFDALAPALQTNIAANDALTAARDDLGPLSIISVLGQMFFAVGIGAAALSAMNVGLLSRILGVIGVAVALFVVLPVIDPQGFMRSFWLIAIGFTLLGRWPGGRPPAWQTGLAQPWPTRAMQLEAAERARAQQEASKERPAPKPKASSGARKRRK